MPNEEELALKCEHLAARFDRSAEKSDSSADDFRGWAAQKAREAEEHPASPELRAVAEGLRDVVAYCEEQAAWSRKMAGKFRRRAEGHRARIRTGP